MADGVSAGLSIAFLSILLMLPFAILHIIGATPSTLEEQIYIRKYGTLYVDTNRSSAYSRGLYYPLFLLHRYLFITTVFMLPFSGLLQSCAMLLSTALFLYYVIKWKPLKMPHDQCLTIFSSLVLLLLYSLGLVFCLLDQSSYPLLRSILGYLFIGIVLLLFLVNVSVIICFKISKCREHCKNKKLGKIYADKLQDFKSKEQANDVVVENSWMSQFDSNWGTVLDSTYNMPVLSAVKRARRIDSTLRTNSPSSFHRE